jgi:hypothetical protein
MPPTQQWLDSPDRPAVRKPKHFRSNGAPAVDDLSWIGLDCRQQYPQLCFSSANGKD